MTRPKLTHYKRPLLFFQNGCWDTPRLRIIWPNGKMQYKAYRFAELLWRRVCYDNAIVGYEDNGERYSKFSSARAAVTAMRKYDKEQGYERADFLGYL